MATNPNSQPVQSAKQGHEESSANQRGTDQSPIVVKLARTKESDQQAEKSSAYQANEAYNNTLLMLFNGILAAVAIFEFIWIVRQELQMKRSHRAYVATERAMMATPSFFATQVYGERSGDDPAGVYAYIFGISWPNTGKTPAVQAIAWTDHRICDPNDAIPTFVKPGDAINGFATVGSNGAPSGPDQIVSSEEVQAAALEKRVIYLYGRVEYSDIFDPGFRHVTEGCFRLVFQGDPYELLRYPLRQDRARFRYTAVGPQNHYQ